MRCQTFWYLAPVALSHFFLSTPSDRSPPLMRSQLKKQARGVNIEWLSQTLNPFFVSALSESSFSPACR
jgi:hypothetical protein